MSFIATVENDIIKLPPGVHLPDGTEVTIEPASTASTGTEVQPRSTLAERLAEFIGVADDLPRDFAINHDHYIHGAPKRNP